MSFFSEDKPPFFQKNKSVVLKGLGLFLVLSFLGLTLYYRSFYGSYDVFYGGEPLLRDGDKVLFSKLTYDAQTNDIDQKYSFSRGNMVIYQLKNSLRIGRILGLPGDKIEIIEGSLYINDVPLILRKLKDHKVPVFGKGFVYLENFKDLKKPHLIFKSLDSLKKESSFKASVVPKNHYYILSDDRGSEHEYAGDSRHHGFIHISALKGKPLFIWFSSGFQFSWARPFLWPFQIRFDRLFQKVE